MFFYIEINTVRRWFEPKRGQGNSKPVNMINCSNNYVTTYWEYVSATDIYKHIALTRLFKAHIFYK